MTPKSHWRQLKHPGLELDRLQVRDQAWSQSGDPIHGLSENDLIWGTLKEKQMWCSMWRLKNRQSVHWSEGTRWKHFVLCGRIQTIWLWQTKLSCWAAASHLTALAWLGGLGLEYRWSTEIARINDHDKRDYKTACFINPKAHHRGGGKRTRNRDPKIWSGPKPLEVPTRSGRAMSRGTANYYPPP